MRNELTQPVTKLFPDSSRLTVYVNGAEGYVAFDEIDLLSFVATGRPFVIPSKAYLLTLTQDDMRFPDGEIVAKGTPLAEVFPYGIGVRQVNNQTVLSFLSKDHVDKVVFW